MKKLILFLGIFISLSACSSSDDDNDTPPITSSIEGTWKIDKIETDIITDTPEATQYAINYITSQEMYEKGYIYISPKTSNSGYLDYLEIFSGAGSQYEKNNNVIKLIGGGDTPFLIATFTITGIFILYEEKVPEYLISSKYPKAKAEKATYKIYYKKVN